MKSWKNTRWVNTAVPTVLAIGLAWLSAGELSACRVSEVEAAKVVGGDAFACVNTAAASFTQGCDPANCPETNYYIAGRNRGNDNTCTTQCPNCVTFQYDYKKCGLTIEPDPQN